MELTAAEARVLGCLIEKAAVAPESYPVSLNDLRLSCNQHDDRDPVVAYDDRTVEDTLLALKSKGLARFVTPVSGGRAPRYGHRADVRWRMAPDELAVLSVLLVSRALSLPEVYERARLLHPFDDRSQVGALLDTLAARMPMPFAARLDGPSAGSRTRWCQVLTGPVPDDVAADAGGAGAADQEGEAHATGADGVPGRQRTGSAVVVSEAWSSGPSPSYGELAARVAELERRLAAASVGAGGGEWRPARPVALGERAEERYPAGGRRWSEPVARVEERALPPGEVVTLASLVERLTDIESRLARIEAELGALR